MLQGFLRDLTEVSVEVRKNSVCPERDRLKAITIEIHDTRRHAAGARTIAGELTRRGESAATKQPT